MEGLIDTVKQGWAVLKAKIAPTDHEAIIRKLSYISKMRESIRDAKSQISTAKGNAQVTKNIGRLAKQFPVDATTAEQLISGMAAYRKRIDVLIRKAIAATKPEDIKRTRQELLVEFNKRGNVSAEIVINKPNMLKLLDEMDALALVIESAGKIYQAKYKEGSKALSVATEGISLESYQETLSVALEDFVGVVGGSFLLLAMIVVRVVAIFVLFGAVGALLGGALAAAVGSALMGSFLVWASQLGLDAATDAIVGE